MSRFDSSVGAIADLLSDVQFRLDDAVDALRRYQELLEYNPTRAGEVEERLHALRGLARKYGPSLVDVVAFLKDASSELEKLEQRQSRSRDLEAEYQQAIRSYETAAGVLSGLRHQMATGFIEDVAKEVQGLGMKQAQFDIRWENVQGPWRWGCDNLDPS